MRHRIHRPAQEALLQSFGMRDGRGREMTAMPISECRAPNDRCHRFSIVVGEALGGRAPRSSGRERWRGEIAAGEVLT
jgi:hypothetical protein